MKRILIIHSLIYLLCINAYSSNVITNIVVYEPPKVVESLYENHPSFTEVDRTRPEGVVFCKTIASNTNQVSELYAASAHKSGFFEMTLSRGITDDFKNEWSIKKLVLSFQYIGKYGPPHWFCFIETSGSTTRTPLFLELENEAWRQGTDVAKYPVRVAFFDICKKHGMFDAKKPLKQSDIDSFINDCRNIDDIITTGMSNDPEHYGSVQIMK